MATALFPSVASRMRFRTHSVGMLLIVSWVQYIVQYYADTCHIWAAPLRKLAVYYFGEEAQFGLSCSVDIQRDTFRCCWLLPAGDPVSDDAEIYDFVFHSPTCFR
jgi:hypothetical protein